MSTRKNFFEFYRKFEHLPSRSFASSVVVGPKFKASPFSAYWTHIPVQKFCQQDKCDCYPRLIVFSIKLSTFRFQVHSQSLFRVTCINSSFKTKEYELCKLFQPFLWTISQAVRVKITLRCILTVVYILEYIQNLRMWPWTA